MSVSAVVDDVGLRVRNLSFGEVVGSGKTGDRSGLAAGIRSRPDLIRTCGSIELPATGHWAIPGGQHLDVTARLPWSRRRSACTIGGRLDVPLDPFTMRLELALVLTGDRRFSAVLCEVTLVEADRLGRWTLTGTASVGGHPSASITLRAWYQGVYDHGARPVALLRIRTRLSLPAYIPPRGRTGARVDLVGDINACRLFTYPASSSALGEEVDASVKETIRERFSCATT